MKRLPLQKPQTMVSPSSSEKSAPKCPIANSLEQNMRSVAVIWFIVNLP